MASQFRGLIGAASKRPEIDWRLQSAPSIKSLMSDEQVGNAGLCNSVQPMPTAVATDTQSNRH